jgi:hypothetical protein
MKALLLLPIVCCILPDVSCAQSTTNPSTPSPSTPSPFDPEFDDPNWPGVIPGAHGAITINIQLDNSPEDIVFSFDRNYGESYDRLDKKSLVSDAKRTKDGEFHWEAWYGFDGLVDPATPGGYITNTTQLFINNYYYALGDYIRFTIQDNGNDGICCDNGNGWVTLTTDKGILWTIDGGLLGNVRTDVELRVNEGNLTILRGTQKGPAPPGTVKLFGSNRYYSTSETTGFFFYMSELDGTLPTEIGLMTAATWMNGEWILNRLTGQLPTEIGLLTSLTFLDFAYTGLTGTIPTELGLLTALTRLRISAESGPGVTGTIPTELGLLTNLDTLTLRGNSLTGTIPTELGAIEQFGVDLGGIPSSSPSGGKPSSTPSAEPSLGSWV